jgi:hypothetical protein
MPFGKQSPDAEREKLKGKYKSGDSVDYRNARGIAVDVRVADVGEDSDGNPTARVEHLGVDGKWHDLGWRNMQSKKHWDETSNIKLKNGQVYLK